MTIEKWDKVKTVFYEAVRFTGKERDEYVNLVCEDAEILNEINSLLNAYDESEKFMEVSSFQRVVPADQENFFIGKYLGKYKIRRLIGRGGMGLVFLGERNDEVKKLAAVKIINPGAVSGTILKRFNNERQTLANLNHSGISKMLDAGVTEDGIQFLVMEYIDGIPIDEYCAEHNLTVRERLGLFIKVIAAVSYAHQNLVIHRDLKPGNILVTEDGEPKLLDFGIAKLVNNESYSEDTMTRRGVFNLTPDYASPEQAAGIAVSTSSDVYSLGIILYKLLTGRTPYTIKNFASTSLSILIRQAEIPKPSEIIFIKDVQKPEEEFPASAINIPGGNPEKLHKVLKGDLDNIISAALKKEPQRRYSSAEQLGEDIKRYLNDQPVTAHKDSFGYRVNKFIKRNKKVVAFALIIIALTLSGVAGILWQSGLTAKERDNAKAEAEKANRIKAFLSQMITAPDPKFEGAEVKMIDVIRQAESNITSELAGQPHIEAEIRTLIGTTYQNLAFYDSAESEMKKALNITRRVYGNKSSETAAALKNLGLVYHYKGDYDKAGDLYKQSLDILKTAGLSASFSYAKSLDIYGTLLTDAGDYEKAKEISLKALMIAEKSDEKDDYDYGVIVNNLATAYNYLGELEKADSIYRIALEIFRDKYGDNHIIISSILNNMAFINIYKDEHNKALPLLEQSVNIKRKVLGDDHPDLVLAYSNLGSTYYNDNQFQAAEKIIRKSVDVGLKNFKEDNINLSRPYMWYGRALEALDRAEEGTGYLAKAFEIRKKELGADNKLTLTTESQYGKCLLSAGKYSEAEKHLLNSYSKLKSSAGEEDEAVKKTAESLTILYTEWGNKSKADYFSKEVSKKNF